MTSIANLTTVIEQEVVRSKVSILDNLVFIDLFGVTYFVKEILVTNGRFYLVPLSEEEESVINRTSGAALLNTMMSLNDLYEILMTQTANLTVRLGGVNMLRIDLGYEIGKISFLNERLRLVATDANSWG